MTSDAIRRISNNKIIHWLPLFFFSSQHIAMQYSGEVFHFIFSGIIFASHLKKYQHINLN
jgi:hypothetical protein